MYESSAQNTPVPSFLRIVTIIECFVVVTAAGALFFFPDIAKIAWAWTIPPFNSRYVGAIYAAALLPLVVFAIAGRWSPGRVVLWMIFTFTASIALVMFMYIPNFEWARPITPIFWLIYIFLPINSTVFLYKLRSWEVYGSEENSPAMRTLLLAIVVALGLYGLGLLVAPETVTAFWPWKVDAFHGRIYAATFLTPALGAWIINRRGSSSERMVLGLTMLTFGVAAILAVIWTSTMVPPDKQVNYASLGAWAFFGMNLLCGAAGLALIQSSRKKQG